MSSQDTESVRKVGKFLENLDILFKGVSETIKNEAKEQNKGLLITLIGASLLGNMLAGKVALLKMIELSKLLFVLVRIAEEQWDLVKIFTSPHSLTNFEIVGCYQNEPKFNGAYLKENLPNFEQIGNSLDHFSYWEK